MIKKISFFVVIVLTTLFLVQPASKPARAAALNWEPMVNPTFTGNRAPGFGDESNIWPFSMVTFADFVYVSNMNITTGTEIWRSANGTDWEQVNLDNFGDVATSSYAILAVFDGHLYAFNYLENEDHIDIYRYNSGTSWEHTVAMTIGDAQTPVSNPNAAVVYNNSLYISLVNENTDSTIYRSTDGTTWNKVNEASYSDGFGNDNAAVYAMEVYNNNLYVGTYNLGGAEVWRYNGTTWTIDNNVGFDNAENDSVGALTSFGGALYATTDNSTTGAEVWKTSGGGTTDWTKVSDTGFGQDTAVVSATGGAVFKGKLYIGTASSARVFRSSDGISWEQVNTDHFGYSDNIMVIFAVLGDYLYAGTGNLNMGDSGPPLENTTEIYRYYEPTIVTTLPQTGFDNPLNAYILGALL